MAYFIVLIAGMAGGALCMFIAIEKKRKAIEDLRLRQEQELKQLKAADAELATRKVTFGENVEKLRAAQNDFQQRAISYAQLHDENNILKRDVSNLAISLRKTQLDHLTQKQTQETIDYKLQELGTRYLKDSVKWISNSLNANNFVNCRQRLQDIIARLRDIGFQISATEEAAHVADLRIEFERLVRAALEREEQARIKAQIREEQKLERDIQREQERLDRERHILEIALAKALAETQGQYSAEIESLKARLAAAEDKQRAISQAQLTKAGFIYVISNIGSFGEGVFKVGMTRRLEPMDRVKELGDASVPFPFDVHMMISCTNAPTLENTIHKTLVERQVNKMNPRKEFFKTDIQTIVEIVKQHHGEVEYVADAEALQYRQSLTMSEEDLKFIEHVFEEAEEDGPTFDEDVSEPLMSSI